MIARTHVASGALSWVALGQLGVTGVDQAELVAGTLIAGVAALLPDLDHPGSTASRSAGLASRLLSVTARTAGGGHRGAMHSPLVIAVGWAALSWLVARVLVPDLAWIADAVGVGAASHVLTVALTHGGVPLVWPLTTRRLGVGLVRTGGMIDRTAGAGAGALALALIVARAPGP